MQHQSWVAGPTGELSTMCHGLRLAVLKHNGFARFLVLEPCGKEHSEEILSSGTEIDLDTAKAAATKAAIRLEAVLANRRAAKH